MLSELLHADEIVLMSEQIERLRNTFVKTKKDFDSKSSKANLEKIITATI